MKLANFRDIGGITTRLGKIKQRRLLRSGELYNLSSNDIHELKNEYNLKLIIDLRSPNESLPRPDAKIEGARYLNLDIMKDLTDNNTGFDQLLTQLDLEAVDKHMLEVYRDIIFNAHASCEYARFMNEIADLEEGAALFHCYAGKDRTGFAAALLLDTLGASKKQIYTDYMLTNEMRKQANAEICKDSIQKYNLTHEQAEALRQFLLIKEIYINETYRVIEKTYGSVEGYLLNGLNLSNEVLEKIRTNYLS